MMSLPKLHHRIVEEIYRANDARQPEPKQTSKIRFTVLVPPRFRCRNQKQLTWLRIPIFFSLLACTGCSNLTTANCITIDDLRIVVDSPKVQTLLMDQGVVDRSIVQSQGSRQPPSASRGGRSDLRERFLHAFENEPSLVVPQGTYLKDVGQSDAKCFADSTSTPTFRKVRVLTGTHKGIEGWTCGPTRPVVPVP
jgi:hypothetical protein